MEQKRTNRRAQQRAAKKKKQLIMVATLAVIVIAVVVGVISLLGAPQRTAYQEAKALLEGGNYREAASAFADLGEYRDSMAQYDLCQEMIEDEPYQAALALKNEGRYAEAAEAFGQLGEYRDSAAQMDACQALANEESYQRAMTLKNEGSYAEAIALFGELAGYQDSEAQAAACEELRLGKSYDEAVALMNAGDYAGAYALFATMKGYKDVSRLVANTPELALQRESALKVGRVVTFGRYRQLGYDDHDTPIRWVILKREGDKALLISQDVLAVKQFHNKRATGGWRPSTLREWLNGSFLETAFDSEERRAISTTDLTVIAGFDIKDKVFLLSQQEAETLFASDAERVAAPTEYAKKRYPWMNDDRTAVAWWLRDSGKSACAMCVSPEGVISTNGTDVYSENIGVRPAVWVTLSSTLF